MKLSGNKRRGKHIGRGGAAGDSISVRGAAIGNDATVSPADGKAKKGGRHVAKKKRTGVQRLLRFGVIFLLIVTALSAGVMALYKATVVPPDVKDAPRTVPTADLTSEGEAPGIKGEDDPGPSYTPVSRKPKYTFVILGTDDGNGNTDTIMVATFDAEKYTLDVVNIPRDTLASFNGRGIKINSMYASIKGKTAEEKMPSFISGLADIVGFEVDFYAIVDLDAFKKLVDGIGGVDFYIPRKMDYDDPHQNLHIHFTKGQKHLNGKEALELVRFRSTATADIGRIEIQQSFLIEAAKQVIEKKNSIKIDALADIFLNDVKTDLTLGNLIWFAREFLKMDAENITFTTLPADFFGDKNYVILKDVDNWLKFVNEKLNPYEVEITSKDVNILTRNPGAGSSTKTTTSSGNSGSSGNNNSSGGSNNNSGNSNNSSNNDGTATASPSTEPEAPPTDTPTDIPTSEPPETGQPIESEPPTVSETPPQPVETPSPEPPENNVAVPEE